MRRYAFTMLELIFVIVVIGIISKFGADIFRSSYDAYLMNSVQNQLQANTEAAVQQIANRLQYRIRNSVIERIGGTTTFRGLSGGGTAAGYNTLEWVGYDIDGWRGKHNGTFNAPLWSGFIDLADFTNNSINQLYSPETNLTEVSTYIASLAPTGSTTTVNNAAIFFTGAQSNVVNDYGWDGNAETNQSQTASHRINDGGASLIAPAPGTGNFAGTDVFEQYKLAWTAYALELDVDGNLWLYYDYQPWEGDDYRLDGTSDLLMDNVSSFRFQAVGDMIKVQVCQEPQSGVTSVTGLYAICKEKAVF